MDNTKEIVVTDTTLDLEKKLYIKTILLYFVGYMIIGALALSLVGSMIATAVHIAGGGVSSDIDAISLLSVDYIFQLQIVLDIIFIAIFIFFWKKAFKNKDLIIDLKNNVIKTIIIGLVFCLVNILLGYITELIVGSGDSSNQETLIMLSQIAPLSLIFSAVIFAPIIEELVFRGSIQTLLYRKFNPTLSAIITGVIFGLIHVVAGLLGGSFVEIIYFITYFAMGAILGLIYAKTKNIYICISVHMLNNLIAVLLMFL